MAKPVRPELGGSAAHQSLSPGLPGLPPEVAIEVHPDARLHESGGYGQCRALLTDAEDGRQSRLEGGGDRPSGCLKIHRQ